MSDKLQLLIAMVGYMLIVIGIGVFFAKKSQASSDNYFLGGRSLGPWVAAMSAEASDMSGWLLMGLPGVAYWCGMADAAWTAIGLAVGTYLNWLHRVPAAAHATPWSPATPSPCRTSSATASMRRRRSF